MVHLIYQYNKEWKANIKKKHLINYNTTIQKKEKFKNYAATGIISGQSFCKHVFLAEVLDSKISKRSGC